MAQQYTPMYSSEFNPPNRSPNRGYNSNTINRQPSRQFEHSYNPPQPQFFGGEDISRYESRGIDRLNTATLHQSPFTYDPHTWNYNIGLNGGAQTIGGTGRQRTTARRPGIPSGWLDTMPQPPPLSGFGMDMVGALESNPAHVAREVGQHVESNEELIPTALVIKNIPFAVKKEQLVAQMTEMNLPLPYAFNYHFDNGIFRGLAFANFTTPDETATVIRALHHLELGGRRLRVEYKKMLPHEDRERIEAEKRRRRGQLQEQHQPPPAGTVHGAASMTSLNSNNAVVTTPSPVQPPQRDFDLNDPVTLNFYNQLILFKTDQSKEHLVFPTTITPAERRIIHTLAHNMGLEHQSEGKEDARYIAIFKMNSNPPPPQLPSSYYNVDSRNHTLNRAATLDFSDVRGDGYHTRSLRQRGSGMLDIPGSPGLSGFPPQNLRAAKSFADLRSYTPSPVPSSASFPAGLVQNISRYTDYGNQSAASGTPNLTPTSADRVGGRDEAFLLNGMNSMSLGFDRPSNIRSNNGGRIGQERENHTSSAGPIGSQRPTNGNHFDDSLRNGTTAPERQPRGPTEWGAGAGFRPRRNGHVNRGSDSSDRSGTRYM